MSMKCLECHFDYPSDSKFSKDWGIQLIPTEEISAPAETLVVAKEGISREGFLCINDNFSYFH